MRVRARACMCVRVRVRACVSVCGLPYPTGAPYTIPELTVETPARRRSEDSTADSAAKAKAADASEPVRTGLFIQLYRSFGMLKSRTILKNARR